MIIYETWLTVIGTALMFSYLFVFEPYNDLIDRYLNFKPFNCVLCLTFWASTLFFWIIEINLIYAIFSAVIAELAYRKLVGSGT
jgi:ABC-type transport system involved in multi-copper enzyme maturation permease subunit